MQKKKGGKKGVPHYDRCSSSHTGSRWFMWNNYMSLKPQIAITSHTLDEIKFKLNDAPGRCSPENQDSAERSHSGGALNMSRQSPSVPAALTAFHHELFPIAEATQAKCIIPVFDQLNGNPSFLFSVQIQPWCGFNRNPLRFIREACCPDFNHLPHLEILCSAVYDTILGKSVKFKVSLNAPPPSTPRLYYVFCQRWKHGRLKDKRVNRNIWLNCSNYYIVIIDQSVPPLVIFPNSYSIKHWTVSSHQPPANLLLVLISFWVSNVFRLLKAPWLC